MVNDCLKYLANYMVSQKGLYGLFSVPGFGKTTLMIYLMHEFLKLGEKCLLFSLEMTEQQVLDKMNRFKMTSDGLRIFDSDQCNSEIIAEKIRIEEPKYVFIDYLQLLGRNTCDLVKELKGIAEQLSVSIFFTGQLSRASGDYDFFNRRPELYDLICSFPAESSLENARSALDGMDLIMFLHRHHDCDRNIGTAHRYNVSNSAELIIKQCVPHLPESFHFDFREMTEELCFPYNINLYPV